MTVKQPSVTKDLGRKYTSIFRCYKIVGATIGRPLWRKANLKPSPRGSLVVGVRSAGNEDKFGCRFDCVLIQEAFYVMFAIALYSASVSARELNAPKLTRTAPPSGVASVL